MHTTARPSRLEVDRGHDRDKDRLLPEDDPLFAALGLADATAGSSRPGGEVPPGRGVPPAARLRGHRGDRQGPAAPADRRGAAAGGRPGCGNAYLTFAAHALPRRRARPARSDLVGVDVQGAVPRAQRRRSRPRSGWTPTFVSGTHRRRRARPGARGGARPARLRHRDRRRAGPGGEWEASLVLAAPCCHHDVAAQLRRAPTPGAVRHAHPARHPARAAGRHAHRRAAGHADAAAGLPRRRRAVRREQAHAAQHAAPRHAHRCAGQGRLAAARVRRPGRDLGHPAPSWPSCSMA